MKRTLLPLVLLAAFAMVPNLEAAPCALFSSCSFNLDTTNVGAFGAGPYGTVNLLLVGSDIKITIDLADGFGFNIIDSGSHEAFTFNNTLGGAVTMSAFSSALYSQNPGAAPFDNSPFSDFDHAVQSTCQNGSGCGVNVLSFTVSRVGGFTDVNQLADLSTGAGIAAYFAVDVANNNGATGVVGAVGPPVNLPEPASLALLLAGLGGFAAIRFRRS